jgi:outer membrane protein insertion porin family
MHYEANAQFESDTIKNVDYTDQKTYEIGGVVVVGAEMRDDNAITSIAGLQPGKKIKIPGPDIENAIRDLWRLSLFTDVQIVQTKLIGDVIFLEIRLKERPTLSKYSFVGVKKSKFEKLSDLVDEALTKGSIVTDDNKQISINKIEKFYIEKGFLDVSVSVEEKEDKSKANAVQLIYKIDVKDKVKIENINFVGNDFLKDRKLRKLLKNTKRKKNFFKKSKFDLDNFEEDKKNLVSHYNSIGFRDAKIVSDTVYRVDGDLNIDFTINEGNQYFYRNITWKGNSIYDSTLLATYLGISKGDVFNNEEMQSRLSFSLDGRDISALYMDKGYLAFRVDPVEIAIVGDSIDLEMRIFEGPQFTIDKVTITGNDRTHEHVIRRELRTRPGDKFNRAAIIRSQREIINLGYFNPESLDIQTPVNFERGTVDIVYGVEETPSDQLELSAGYGGFSGLIGTLGITFNNFSIRNIKDRSTWNPLPQGDGQKLSLRAQSNSRFFRSFNFSLTEPWLGGKKRNSFSIGAVMSKFNYTSLGQGLLDINRIFVGLGTQLKWPDDFFASSTTLTLETLKLDDYVQGNFFVTNGDFNNFSIKQTIARSSVSEPIFPRSGSRVSLSLQLTPPYSLFRSDDYYVLSDGERTEIRENLQLNCGECEITQTDINNAYNEAENGKKFKWLEYYKFRFDAEWYFNIVGKLVMMTSIKMGALGSYNSDIGTSPFERFELGGDGLSNQQSGITGKDIISLRGYEVSDLPANDFGIGGATIFDKFTMELRYPLSLNPSSTIYVAAFMQAGNAWSDFREFNPFDVKRSAGFGVRIFLPMFGLLGFDYSFGFDRTRGIPDNAGFGDYAKFNIILGFEPD